MAYKCREEIVGKRFLSVRSPTKLKVSKISEWEWRSGVVRAVSSRDTASVDFTVSFHNFFFSFGFIFWMTIEKGHMFCCLYTQIRQALYWMVSYFTKQLCHAVTLFLGQLFSDHFGWQRKTLSCLWNLK